MKRVDIDERAGEILDRLIASGHFKSDSEAVSISLHVLNERLESFRDDVARGIEDFREGRFSTRTVLDIAKAARRELGGKLPE